jgi:hypothetical protein
MPGLKHGHIKRLKLLHRGIEHTLSMAINYPTKLILSTSFSMKIEILLKSVELET